MARAPLPEVGARFGKLTFIDLDRSRMDGDSYWVMSCDCGTTKSFLAANVRRGNTRSCCGSANARRQDLIGKRFGRLVALEKVRSTSGRVQWRCRCDCGGETIAFTASLNSGHTRSCGCLQREKVLGRFIDIAGQKFGKLSVLSRVSGREGAGARWLCACDCGGESVVLGSRLRSGEVVSCGCAVGSHERLRPSRIVERYNSHRHVRRARLRRSEGTFTPQQVSELLAKQRGRCAWCRSSLKNGFHRDHKMPLALGGSNDISNIELLCATCNLAKSAKDPIQWANENGLLL